MSNLSGSFKSFWNYLWQLHEQSKKMMRLDFTAFTKSHDMDKEKEELAKKVMPNGTVDNSNGGNGGDTGPPEDGPGYSVRQKIGLGLGPALFLIFLLMPTPAEMSPAAQAVLASTAWVATWWICESIPIPATSLLPVILFPITGALDTADVTPSYANHLVFLFMGGFMIALAMEKWNLHRRIALNIIKTIGGSPKRIILGFMVATAFLSMWISNTATTMMMTPIGLAVILQFAYLIQQQGLDIDVSVGKFRFGTALMLGIAYAASIGGVATIIGTPPNAVFVGVVKEMWDRDIAFVTWMMYGVPLAAVSLIACWYYLTNLAFKIEFKHLPGGLEVITDELKKLGSITREESKVLIVFVAVALLWISRGFFLGDIFPSVSDATIAVLGAVALFIIPVNLQKGLFILDWNTILKLPWGILLLFGGGFAIANGFSETGLAEWIATRLAGLEGASMVIIALAVVVMAIFLTEITSNTATSTMLMPIMASLGIAMGVHPYALMITAALACSFAFMLPVATPPNAIVFGSGYISIPQMAKAGAALNVFGVIIITIMTLYYLPLIWGIDFSTMPSWVH